MHRAICILIVLVVTSISYSLLADDMLRFEIRGTQIESGWIFEARDEYYQIMIKLKEPWRDDLVRLAEANMGKQMFITNLGDVLVSGTIRVNFDSGVIVIGTSSSRDEAVAILRKVILSD